MDISVVWCLFFQMRMLSYLSGQDLRLFDDSFSSIHYIVYVHTAETARIKQK